MERTIKIENKLSGLEQPVFIIAEAGVNHNGRLALALKLVDVAADAGADAVKFQTFRAEQVTIASGKMAEYQKRNLGKTESQLAMLKRLELKEKYYPALIKRAKERKIIFLSSPHGGFESVDFLKKLKISAFKFGSGDLTNLPLLGYAAKFKKPMIISTGMGNLQEIKEAVAAIKKAGNNKIAILHCTTNYPTALNKVNLLAMKTIEKEFGLPVGYSDHTIGIKVSVAAVALGARIIEKHFTLDKTLTGPDHKASLDPAELKELIKQIRITEKRLASGENSKNLIKELNVQKALGDGIKKPVSSELIAAKIGRKSLVARFNIPKETKITGEMLDIKRPGTGIEPKYFKMVIGKIASKDIARDALITFKDLK
ncbi:MAG: N-acetylneuraminate synthase family protein [bacterium]|nr:N-acetylneuraminate synthase family protein [bacterium]